jgi:signal transduction histidine kinase
MTAQRNYSLSKHDARSGATVPHDFTVLIVEDDDDARRNMEDILSLDGYHVKSVTRCLAAIEAVEKATFGAVIVDWRLPDQNADELIPLIIRLRPDTPVVVVTGLRDFDTAVTALRSGAYDFLLKPINPDVLRSVLNRIVERQKNLTALKDARDKLLMNERLAAIGEMVTGLAHESRNAFQRSHACLAELMLDLEDMPESIKLVQKVQKALDDVHQLLEEVRNYSAPIILKRTNCCLETVFRETWQQILDARQLSIRPVFTLKKSDRFPEKCYVDADRIQQVIRNLLENALFACADSAQIKIGLGFHDRIMPCIRLEVTDNGEGIAGSDREKIFAPFFTTKTKGTGLGLSVSRRYVDAHGGRMYVDFPKPGAGATFVVEFPYVEK